MASVSLEVPEAGGAESIDSTPVTPVKRRYSEEVQIDAEKQGIPMTASQMEAVLTEGWSPGRKKVRALLHHQRTDAFMGSVIVLNIALMMFEANHVAKCYPEACPDDAITWLNRSFLIFYTLEAALRAYVDRDKYFHDKWNCLDLFIVIFGWMDEGVVIATQGQSPSGMQMLPMLRIFRVARLLRTLRLLRFFPELYVMIRGFIGAMKAMFWGFLLIVILIFVWALIIVELLHPANFEANAELMREDPDYQANEYCQDAFVNIFQMALLLFQTLVAGDSWGMCLLPVIQHQTWTFIPLALALVSVSLGFMNLILAAIVDNAMVAREGDREDKAKEKKAHEAAAIKEWLSIVKRLDKDGNGSISYDEMMEAFEDDAISETMQVLGIDQQDFSQMFSLMDIDGSGDLDYDEFIQSFMKAHEMDERVYRMLTKLQIDSVAFATKRIVESTKLEDVGELPTSVAAAKLDAEAVSLEADFQRINRRIQEQLDAFSKVLKSEVQDLANRRVQERSDPHARSSEGNASIDAFTTPPRQADALKAGPHANGAAKSPQHAPAHREESVAETGQDHFAV